MSTHNISIWGEISTIFTQYLILSVVMKDTIKQGLFSKYDDQCFLHADCKI